MADNELKPSNDPQPAENDFWHAAIYAVLDGLEADARKRNDTVGAFPEDGEAPAEEDETVLGWGRAM